MIRVDVTGAALAELRIVTSPLWETFGSLSTLALGRAAPWPYSDWCRAAERTLLHRLGGELVTWARLLRGPMPAALTPIPAGPDRSIEDELETLIGHLSQLSRQHLTTLAAVSGSGPPPDGGVWLRWLSAAVLDYWQAALAPYWTAMHTALRDDVLARASVLVRQGTGEMLSTLDQRMRWLPPVLEVTAAVPSCDLRCDSRLVVVPLIFGRRITRCVSDGAGRVAVSYQARGTAVLGKPSPLPARGSAPPARGDRLAILVGGGKAAVLRALSVPSTTSDVAESLGMSASTVSQHLSRLLAAGLVHKRRMGVRVVYGLEHAGLVLLRHLDEDRPSK